jgi:hypothetical protein
MMRKEKNALAEINTNALGDYLEDYQNETLNRAMDKLLVMNEGEMSLDSILSQFTEVEDVDYDLALVAVNETLKSVNQVFRNMGIDLEFKSADFVDYGGFILTVPSDSPADIAQRIRKLVDM